MENKSQSRYKLRNSSSRNSRNDEEREEIMVQIPIKGKKTKKNQKEVSVEVQDRKKKSKDLPTVPPPKISEEKRDKKNKKEIPEAVVAEDSYKKSDKEEMALSERKKEMKKEKKNKKEMTNDSTEKNSKEEEMSFFERKKERNKGKKNKKELPETVVEEGSSSSSSSEATEKEEEMSLSEKKNEMKKEKKNKKEMPKKGMEEANEVEKKSSKEEIPVVILKKKVKKEEEGKEEKEEKVLEDKKTQESLSTEEEQKKEKEAESKRGRKRKNEEMTKNIIQDKSNHQMDIEITKDKTNEKEEKLNKKVEPIVLLSDKKRERNKVSNDSTSLSTDTNDSQENTNKEEDEDIELVVGAKLPVLVHSDPNTEKKYQMGEIITIKKEGSTTLYYIHFVNQDKRMDEWKEIDQLWTKKKYPNEEPTENSHSRRTKSTKRDPYLLRQPLEEGKMTRNMKRKYGIINNSLQSLSEIDPKLAALEKEREEITKVKNIQKVQFGKYLLNTWYFSPYPNEYKEQTKLYICEYCMKYMIYEETLINHKKECKLKHPPGKLIYKKKPLSVYEIDGKNEKLYCQNFCLLSKLFLDHKTVYYDIEPFLFYVLTETRTCNNEEVDHVIGYFSKEKKSFDDYNLACILVLPPYQRKGYGHFLIEFSYELSKIENKIGSPEKPLSDLGLVGYRTYWQSVLLRIIKNNPNKNFTLKELSHLTSIQLEDIVSTLGSMNMLRYWKGEHLLCVTPKMIEEFLNEHQNIKTEPMVDASLIQMTPPPEEPSHKRKKLV